LTTSHVLNILSAFSVCAAVQGLEIEHCGGDVYEDISAYAQPTDAEWEVESPEQE